MENLCTMKTICRYLSSFMAYELISLRLCIAAINAKGSFIGKTVCFLNCKEGLCLLGIYGYLSRLIRLGWVLGNLCAIVELGLSAIGLLA
jgi:hypothetical protein